MWAVEIRRVIPSFSSAAAEAKKYLEDGRK